jgi:hypothetical protein
MATSVRRCSRVCQLIATGKLERHPDGGITRASVKKRVVDQM